MAARRAFATIATVWRKEVRESLRDRRTLMSALLFGPLFGPLILAASLQFLVHRSAEEADQRIELAVRHAERAPSSFSTPSICSRQAAACQAVKSGGKLNERCSSS